MLEVYAVSGNFDNIVERVKARYDGLLDRFGFYIPYRAEISDEQWRHWTKQFNG